MNNDIIKNRVSEFVPCSSVQSKLSLDFLRARGPDFFKKGYRFFQMIAGLFNLFQIFIYILHAGKHFRFLITNAQGVKGGQCYPFKDISGEKFFGGGGESALYRPLWR